MSDVGNNFSLEKFIIFYEKQSTKHALLSVYHWQSSKQVEACIKCPIKKGMETNYDIHLALLQDCQIPSHYFSTEELNF